MTRKSKKAIIRKRVKELIKKTLNSKDLDKMINSMLTSGSIDLDEYNPDSGGWRIPRNMTCAISKELWKDHQPIKTSDKKEIESLYVII